MMLLRAEDLGWERPMEFIPERWEEEKPHYAKSSFIYLPFGGGPRSCVGE
jgi:cytochrome P450